MRRKNLMKKNLVDKATTVAVKPDSHVHFRFFV